MFFPLNNFCFPMFCMFGFLRVSEAKLRLGQPVSGDLNKAENSPSQKEVISGTHSHWEPFIQEVISTLLSGPWLRQQIVKGHKGCRRSNGREELQTWRKGFQFLNLFLQYINSLSMAIQFILAFISWEIFILETSIVYLVGWVFS